MSSLGNYIQLTPLAFMGPNIRPNCLPLLSVTRDADVIECKHNIVVPENTILHLNPTPELISCGYNIAHPRCLLTGTHENVLFTLQKITSTATPISNLLPILNGATLNGCRRDAVLVKRVGAVVLPTNQTKPPAPIPADDLATIF